MTDTSHKRYPVPPGVHWGDPRFTPAQDAILACIRGLTCTVLQEGVTASEIAETLTMSRQAAQQTLHRLLEKGLVSKTCVRRDVVFWKLKETP